jgi:lipopolysaccharide export LptBFGC system permease protein LptF
MMSRAVQLASIIVAIGFWSAAAVPAWAEAGDSAALAAAMKNATATLQGGLKASEAQGTPISAKFEIEDGKLQLSIYTMKGNDFMEVVADPNTGAIAKSEKITDAGDLKEAAEQKAAMAKAKVPLLTATETAVKANAGSRAVSIVPELKNGQAMAEVTLLQGTAFKKVTETLD